MTLQPRWERFLCDYVAVRYRVEAYDRLLRVLAEHDAERAGTNDSTEARRDAAGPNGKGGEPRPGGGSRATLPAEQPAPKRVSQCRGIGCPYYPCRCSGAPAHGAPDGGRLSRLLRLDASHNRGNAAALERLMNEHAAEADDLEDKLAAAERDAAAQAHEVASLLARLNAAERERDEAKRLANSADRR